MIFKLEKNRLENKELMRSFKRIKKECLISYYFLKMIRKIKD
jgi:hypothetical protein